jgi:hypothetical protein
MVAAALPSAAGAAPFIQTVGLEHELETRYYSIVTDRDDVSTQRQIIDASAAYAATTGQKVKELGLVCYFDDGLKIFCLTNDDGNVLEVVGEPWVRTDYAAMTEKMQKGLADLDALLVKSCRRGNSSRPVRRGDPIFSAGGNTWAGRPSKFKGQNGCVVQLSYLVDTLEKSQRWQAETTADMLDHVHVFRADQMPTERIRVSNTQVNVTVPLARFADPAFGVMFSTLDAPDRPGRLRIGAMLWRASHAHPHFEIGPVGKRVDVAIGLENLLHHTLGVLSLWQVGPAPHPYLNQGHHKNSHVLYLKSLVHEVVARAREEAVDRGVFKPKQTRSYFWAALLRSRLTCEDACDDVARAMWDETIDPDHRPVSDADWAAVKRRWSQQYDANILLVRDDQQVGYIHNRWAPELTDDGVVVLVEMRDQSYAVNQAHALYADGSGKLVLDPHAELPLAARR